MRFLALLLILGVYATPAFCSDTEPEAAPTPEKMNEAFALPIWLDTDLWENKASDLAERLHWPKESETKDQASYRSYSDDTARILGQRPYSLVLHTENDKPSQLIMIFINKGDYENAYALEKQIKRTISTKDKSKERELTSRYEEILKSFPDALQKEATALEAALTQILGPGNKDKFGQGKKLREKVTRWDWHSHAILLSEQEEEYVSIRIMSTEAADNGGKLSRRSDAEVKSLLLSRVEKRLQGDVVITQIPMVNQGPKGFCVPATWERYLRYMGISCDMYTLAMAGQTDFGGGTNVNQIAASVSDMVKSNGRRLDKEGPSLEPRDLAASIDQGLPLMWAMHIDRILDSEISARSREREQVTDWSAWKESLKPMRKKARDIKIDRESGHVCMIIGYNQETGEIATSDSWGPGFEERWYTQEEAEALSQGDLRIIRW
jgi:hypothetical protein